MSSIPYSWNPFPGVFQHDSPRPHEPSGHPVPDPAPSDNGNISNGVSGPVDPISPDPPFPIDTAVTLGEDASLTAGIPGEGPLTIEQIRSWVSDLSKHEELDFKLPFGLNAAPEIPSLANNPLTRAKIELGRQLYFDTRMSADGTIGCVSCHDPDEGFTRHTRFGIGVGGQEGGRNSPVSYNRILSTLQFWDGRAASVEDQAKGPIEAAIEHGITHEIAVETISGIEGYRIQFEAVFDNEGVTIDNIAKAIASFERVIVTGPSPYDYYNRVLSVLEQFDEEEMETLAEDEPDIYLRYQDDLAKSEAMGDSAIHGRELFFSDRVGCTACHVGANFTDEKFHNIGIGMDADEPDVGRFSETADEAHRGAFKTPTCRNVASSYPYMHDGSLATLMDVVEWYAKGGHPNDQLSDKIKQFEATDQDKQDLVAFLESLTGKFPAIERGRLPQ